MNTRELTLDEVFEISARTDFEGFDSKEVIKSKPLFLAVIKRTMDLTEAVDVVKFVLRGAL